MFSSAWVICPLKWNCPIASSSLWLPTLALGVTSRLPNHAVYDYSLWLSHGRTSPEATVSGPLAVPSLGECHDIDLPS